ncbi:aspartyl-tRNA amidotransferase subunit B [Amylibacter marinus]|uniref:Aspartyl-tRNA amidotransferase subunit B n=1 Tax=Amylibacter marinus TaxID=1475483 RepID=A0ABQ5VTW0_9RHOB|nr:GatB/YqeY domain-containing protein [Amylibacter marinus]GLQ34558.1 aspartyl-tRNA amidotransferase subunit B [Amylibacter marinus]
MRDKINASMKQAMRDKEATRLSTLRLIMAAIKDRDIALRPSGNDEGVDDSEILSILAKMIKQRKDSAEVYQSAGREELACRENNEIKVIEEFLPKQLSADEVNDAVKEAISEIGADSIRDMGKVMGALKAKYSGQMDFGKAGGAVKALLG